MAPIKKQVIKMIEGLPDDVAIDGIMEELYFKSQVLEGIKLADQGNLIPQSEIEKQALKWFKEENCIKNRAS
jgi:hypothetical protein